MEQSELVFTYVIGTQELYAPEPTYHKHLHGRCLTGTVVKCENETVKLQFDIDEESGKTKSEAELYPFPWKPETGNLLYCMPEKDTVVSLYIGGPNEGEAIVINTLRKKDGKDTAKPENRYLTSVDNKRLFMKEKGIGFSVEDKDDGKTHFVLQDDKGITFQTKSAITIQAKGKIQINGKTIIAKAKKAVNLTQDSAQIGLRSKKVSIMGSSIHLGYGAAMMELLSNPKYNINLKGKTPKDAQTAFNEFMRSNVWNQASLSNAEKVELTKKNFSNLSYEQMENFNVIANADALDSKQDYTDWGASGNWPPINWPNNMGLADGYQEVDRSNPVPAKLDRIGSLTGSNFGVMPDDGHIYNQDDRSIPYVDNANAYHQYSFDSTNYFDYIDCISDENNTTPDKLNEMIKRNAVDGDVHEEITQKEYDVMKQSLNRFTKEQETMGTNSKYGLIGNAARWENDGNLVGSGGAGQLNTPVNGFMLEKMGVLKEIKK